MKTTTLLGLTMTTILLLAPPTFARRQHDHKNGATTTTPPAATKPAPKGDMGTMMQGGMGEKCMMMMRMHEKMGADTDAQDARIKVLTNAMDESSGDQKVSAMAAVITELVAQRAARKGMTDQMQSQMMGHMMDHMTQGKDSMMKCPMMSGGKPKGMTGGGMMEDMKMTPKSEKK